MTETAATTTSRGTETTEGAIAKRRWLTLYVLCAGMLMIILDATIVNVALPSIQDDLGFSQSSLAWVVNAYLIPSAACCCWPGRLGDLIGRRTDLPDRPRRLHRRLAPLRDRDQSQGMLIGARFVQGVGGAMASAVILGMIVTMFPDPPEQAKAIGVYSFVASAGASIGLLAGGVLTEAINWHWIFFVNLPIGLSRPRSGLPAARARPRDRPRAWRRRARSGADHERADARRLHDRRGCRLRLGLGPDADPRRRVGPAARRLRRPRGTGPPTRWRRCGSSGPATSPARTRFRC